MTATTIANPKMTDGYHISMPTTIGTSQVLNAGWSSPNNTTLTFNENPSLLDADIVTVVVGCSIEAYPSNHLDSFRSLTNPKYIFLDEADMFRKGEQEDVRHVKKEHLIPTAWMR